MSTVARERRIAYSWRTWSTSVARLGSKSLAAHCDEPGAGA